jgi:hypothetical protein
MEPKQNKRIIFHEPDDAKRFFEHRKKFKESFERAQEGLDRIERSDRESAKMWEPIVRAEFIEKRYPGAGAGGDIRGMTKRLIESKRYKEVESLEPDLLEMGRTYQDIQLASTHYHYMTKADSNIKRLTGRSTKTAVQHRRDVWGEEGRLVQNLKDRGSQIFGSLLLEDIRQAYHEDGLQFDV